MKITNRPLRVLSVIFIVVAAVVGVVGAVLENISIVISIIHGNGDGIIVAAILMAVFDILLVTLLVVIGMDAVKKLDNDD